MAGGNAEALWQFYQNTPEAEQPWAKSPAPQPGLKDWRDAKPEILRAHLTAALALPGKEKAEFIPHVLCPQLVLNCSPIGVRPFWPALPC